MVGGDGSFSVCMVAQSFHVKTWDLLVKLRRCKTRVQMGWNVACKTKKLGKAKYDNSLGTFTLYCGTRVSSD